MTSPERIPEPSNPLGMDGIEFIEYATSQPQAFGDLLQRMGFVPLARHRSREVMLYRQGPMNLIVNSHGATTAMPTVSAVALRVRDAAFAHKHSLDLGAWDMPTRASAMELNIPSTVICSASRCCRAASISACCPRARCSRVPATSSISS